MGFHLQLADKKMALESGLKRAHSNGVPFGRFFVVAVGTIWDLVPIHGWDVYTGSFAARAQVRMDMQPLGKLLITFMFFLDVHDRSQSLFNGTNV